MLQSAEGDCGVEMLQRALKTAKRLSKAMTKKPKPPKARAVKYREHSSCEAETAARVAAVAAAVDAAIAADEAYNLAESAYTIEQNCLES